MVYPERCSNSQPIRVEVEVFVSHIRGHPRHQERDLQEEGHQGRHIVLQSLAPSSLGLHVQSLMFCRRRGRRRRRF